MKAALKIIITTLFISVFIIVCNTYSKEDTENISKIDYYNEGYFDGVNDVMSILDSLEKDTSYTVNIEIYYENSVKDFIVEKGLIDY